MKGDMEVEILTEPKDTLGAKRKARCIMSAEEQELYRYDANAAKNNRNPGYPTDYYMDMD